MYFFVKLMLLILKETYVFKGKFMLFLGKLVYFFNNNLYSSGDTTKQVDSHRLNAKLY